MTPDDIKQRFPDLKQVTAQDLEHLLDAASRSEVPAGADIISKGAESNALYLICEGLVRVSLEAEDECTVLGDFGPGQWIGEMGMIDPAIAVATATATKDCIVLRLAHDDFMSLRRQCPTLTSILLQLFSNDLAKRLRSTVRFVDGVAMDLDRKEIDQHWYTEIAKHVLGIAARIGA